MSIGHLSSFYVTVKNNSISKAAKILHLTQPALSMQLQSLESEMGVTLLIRSNKGVELTREGKIVFEHTKSILSIEQNIIRDLNNLKTEKTTLTIASCKNLGEYTLPCSIYTFKEIYPNIDISLEIENSADVIKKLKENDINIGIVFESKYELCENIVFEPLLSDKFILVSNINEPMNNITLNDILDMPMIMRAKNCVDRTFLENILVENSINIDNLNIVLSMGSPESIKSAVLSGVGFAFLPEIVVRQSLRGSMLKKINIENFEANFNYYLAYRKDQIFNESEIKFMNFIKSKKRCFCC